MAEVRIDDDEYDAPELAVLSHAAYGLFVRARGYAARHQTDNRIPSATLFAMCSHAVRGGVGTACELIDELVSAQVANADGTSFVLTVPTVSEKRRQAAKLRMRERRRNDMRTACEQIANTPCEQDANILRTSRARAPRASEASESEQQHGEPNAAESSTLPEPSGPEVQRSLSLALGGLGGSSHGSGKGAGRGTGGGQRKVRSIATVWPPGLALTDDLRRFARDGSLDPDLTWAHFRDHHMAKGTRFLDWSAAFRTWCRRSVEQFGRRA